MISVDPKSFLTGIREITAWIISIGTAADALHVAAIKALNEAAFETRRHLSELRDGSQSAAVNRDLMRLWLQAHENLLALDVELAIRCQFKADYWADPTGWDSRQMTDEGLIDLDALLNETRRLIRDCFNAPR